MKKAATLVASAAALSALAIFAVGGASATAPAKAGPTVITMEQEGRELFFEGPATVAAGTTLKIKNNTNPRKIGPHTFSLVKEKNLPLTNKQIKACSRQLKKICGAIVRWHKVDFQTFEIGVNPVEADRNGWDQMGSLSRKGDSWFAERRKESFKQKVGAPEGKTLTYFCAIHAEMAGEIKVTDG